MSRTLLPPILALAACTLRPYDYETGATDTASSSSTASPTTTTTTAAVTTTDANPTASTTAPSSTSGSTSAGTPDDLGWPVECDIWEDGCPEGQKCMPASLDGDSSWESTICVPLVPDPAQLGEPCTSGPISIGEDTCDKHLMCWNQNREGEGTCIAMCSGSPADPECADPCTFCFVSGSGVLNLCLALCDPVAQDCPSGGNVCIPNPAGEGFVCVIDASGEGGQVFDWCEYANVCDPGLTCNDPAFALECDQDALGCCLPFCDITKPDTCPGMGQVCTPWYDEGEGSACLQHVGLCRLP